MGLKSFHQPEKFSDTGKPLSPAEQAREVIDRRIGGVAMQNYNWRRIALGLLVACIVLSIGLTVQSLKSQIIPYVVTVDKSTGEVEKAGAFIAQDYTPQEVEVRYFIGQFIQNARNIQLDPVQQEKMQGKAFAYLTQAAAQKYAAIQRNEGFKDKYAMYTVQTKITGIKKIPDTDSYHATWTEEEFNIASGKQEVKKYECVFEGRSDLARKSAGALHLRPQLLGRDWYEAEEQQYVSAKTEGTGEVIGCTEGRK